MYGTLTVGLITMINTIVLTFGYAESSSISQLIFVNRSDQMEEEEALKTLAEDMYAFYLSERIQIPTRPCCKKATSAFCPHCGRANSTKNDNYIEFADFMWDLLSFNADNYGSAAEYVSLPDGSFHDMRWVCSGAEVLYYNKKNECLIFDHSSSRMLAEVLRKHYPDRLKDYEDVEWYKLDCEIKEARMREIRMDEC
jgi:hypothetical protein